MLGNLLANVQKIPGQPITSGGGAVGLLLSLGSDPKQILEEGIANRNSAKIFFGLRSVREQISDMRLLQYIYTILDKKIIDQPDDIASLASFIPYIKTEKNEPNILNNAFPEHNGNTLMHVAAKSGYSVVVETLIKRGANFDLPNTYGQRPVQMAYWDLKTLKLLLDKYTEPGTRGEMIIKEVTLPFKSLLEFAVEVNQSDIVDYLLNQPGVIAALKMDSVYFNKIKGCIKDEIMEYKIQQKVNPRLKALDDQSFEDEYLMKYTDYTPQSSLTSEPTPQQQQTNLLDSSHQRRRVGFRIKDD